MSNQRNIILTGFMGSGKTTVGRILADRLKRKFVDTDHLIESRHGEIQHIVSNTGWPGFRALELETAKELSKCCSLVVSTGGRMMLDKECATYLEPYGDVVCLQASHTTIVERLLKGNESALSKRPLLARQDADPRETIKNLLEQRADLYSRYQSVDTTNMSPDEVADSVMKLLGITQVGIRQN